MSGLTLEDARMVVERAVDRALGEVRRQGGPEYLLTEARTSGVDTTFGYPDVEVAIGVARLKVERGHRNVRVVARVRLVDAEGRVVR